MRSLSLLFCRGEKEERKKRKNFRSYIPPKVDAKVKAVSRKKEEEEEEEEDSDTPELFSLRAKSCSAVLCR